MPPRASYRSRRRYRRGRFARRTKRFSRRGSRRTVRSRYRRRKRQLLRGVGPVPARATVNHYFIENAGLVGVTDPDRCNYIPLLPYMWGTDFSGIATELGMSLARAHFECVGTQKIMVSLADLAITHITMYVCQFRKIIASVTTATISTDITTGFADNAYTLGATDPNLSLYNSIQFVNNYKILYKKSWTMYPGTASANRTFYLPRRYKRVSMEDENVAALGIQNLTTFVVFRLHSVPKINADETITAVGLGKTRIAVKYWNRYKIYRQTEATALNKNTQETAITTARMEVGVATNEQSED